MAFMEKKHLVFLACTAMEKRGCSPREILSQMVHQHLRLLRKTKPQDNVVAVNLEGID